MAGSDAAGAAFPAAIPAAVPLLDHGAIGNGRVIALVSPSSAIEWLCMPRFDSPSVLARLLDRRIGGVFAFTHHGREIGGSLEYLPNTNVLRTRFEDGEDAWEIVDFAPRLPAGLGVKAPAEIVRVLRPLRGLPVVGVRFDPRPDYGRCEPDVSCADEAIHVSGGGQSLRLATNAPLAYVLSGASFTLRETLVFRLGHAAESPSPLGDALHELDQTVAGWRAWSKSCSLPSYQPAAVLRSALCLALHASHDTGAIIAAATTSIPEALGTERTWDYRYCWLRDSAFVVEGLRRLGQLREGERFVSFLLDVARSGPLQPLVGIGTERDLHEEILDHLEGFAGNGPVRIGNAAMHQVQNDVLGELVLCLETLLRDPRLVHDNPEAFHSMIKALVEDAVAAAPRQDMGIWEFRAIPRHYTFSRAMCWVAIDRGARLAALHGWTEEAARWGRIAEAEREVVLSRGYNEELGFFTQGLDGVNLDASNLLLPTLGLLDARDPRFVSTVEASQRFLVENGLMLRYRNPDDFGETTSAFTICSFWWAEALALMGRLDEAVEVFERVLAHANPLGLFSEDIEPSTGRLLGNFPQAYTHVGLIHAAMTIGKLLDARDGRVRAWT